MSENKKQTSSPNVKKVRDFCGTRKVFLIISLSLIAVTILATFILKINVAIEFKGGTILNFKYSGEIDENEITAIKDVREKFSNEDLINEFIKELDKYKNNKNKKYINIKEFFEVFKNLNHITPNDPLGLNDAIRYFWQSEEDKEIYLSKHESFNKFENILVYFIFRYFMKAVFDYDVLAKIKTTIVSYLMIKELCVVKFTEEGRLTDSDIVDISHMYSKDIEHLEENIEKLAEIFEINDVFKVEEIINVLIN